MEDSEGCFVVFLDRFGAAKIHVVRSGLIEQVKKAVAINRDNLDCRLEVCLAVRGAFTFILTFILTFTFTFISAFTFTSAFTLVSKNSAFLRNSLNKKKWWGYLDLNQGPWSYEHPALTN